MPRKSVALHGILAAVTTPFTADASAVDEAALTAQAEWLIGSGIHGLVPCGTTGEFPTLTPDEHRRVIELYVKAAAGRVPVIAGVGALSTAAAIDLAQDAERLGADAVMVVPPFYDPLDFATLTTFLRAVAESISLPIVYYNVPGATGIRLNADQIAELGEIDGVDYLKDTSGDAVTLTDLLVNRTDKIKAFNGWDTLTFIGMALGAEAAVWGAAGVVPELAVRLWDTLGRQGRPGRGPRAVAPPVGDQRLPGVGQLRRGRQGRSGARRPPGRTAPGADPTAVRRAARHPRRAPEGAGVPVVR